MQHTTQTKHVIMHFRFVSTMVEFQKRPPMSVSLHNFKHVYTSMLYCSISELSFIAWVKLKDMTEFSDSP